jgi:hypothetical protein
MDANNAETTPRSAPVVPEGVAILLWVGGLLVAAYGVVSTLDAGFEHAGPILKRRGTLPIGFWTIEFLVQSVFGVVIAVLEEVVNKYSVVGGIACFIGYILQPAPSGATK